MIFVEKDEPLSWDEVQSEFERLMHAAQTNDEDIARECLHSAIKTFKPAEEVNKNAEHVEQMRIAGV